MARQMEELFYCKHIEALLMIHELTTELQREFPAVEQFIGDHSYVEWYELLIYWANEFEEQFSETEDFLYDIEGFTTRKLKSL